MTTTGPDANASDTIVLIHGLWMTPLCWEHWIERYSARGYKVLAPAWPGMDDDIDQLRSNPAPIAALSAKRIVEHYESIIRGLEKPPIVMGHSFGGAFTQVMLSRGLGAAGVAIDSAPVRGVLKLPISTVRTAWPMLRNPLMRHKAVSLTPAQFHYAFTNTLTEAESLEVYQRYHVPGSRDVLVEGANANLNPNTTFKVDFHKADRAPLLLVAGGKDHVVPASITRETHGRYKSSAIADYREFPERSHYTLGQAGWEEVADFALDWAASHASTPAAGVS